MSDLVCLNDSLRGDNRCVCELQVACMEAASAAEAPAPAPVVIFEAFRSLCSTPPLQVSFKSTGVCSLPYLAAPSCKHGRNKVVSTGI